MRIPKKGSYWIEREYPTAQPIRVLDVNWDRVILDPNPLVMPVERYEDGFIYNGAGPVELHISFFNEVYRKPQKGELELSLLAFAGV